MIQQGALNLKAQQRAFFRVQTRPASALGLASTGRLLVIGNYWPMILQEAGSVQMRIKGRIYQRAVIWFALRQVGGIFHFIGPPRFGLFSAS